MRGILASEDVGKAGDLVGEVKWHCLQSPLADAGDVYVIWAELDDVLDGYPVDYGPEANAIYALREFKRAAHDWLDMPRTEAGLLNYVQLWKTRIADDAWPAPGGVHWRQARRTHPGNGST
ncbi:hypothetical protein ACFQ07_03140 [Actinomadura adrarensis]|uniref:Uncharacterized protein n=1 Tax=Actinomadura adrarensis TaxID=1819600 RepID=A0ABW3CC29_9ACTN